MNKLIISRLGYCYYVQVYNIGSFEEKFSILGAKKITDTIIETLADVYNVENRNIVSYVSNYNATVLRVVKRRIEKGIIDNTINYTKMLYND